MGWLNKSHCEGCAYNYPDIDMCNNCVDCSCYTPAESEDAPIVGNFTVGRAYRIRFNQPKRLRTYGGGYTYDERILPHKTYECIVSFKTKNVVCVYFIGESEKPVQTLIKRKWFQQFYQDTEKPLVEFFEIRR